MYVIAVGQKLDKDFDIIGVVSPDPILRLKPTTFDSAGIFGESSLGIRCISAYFFGFLALMRVRNSIVFRSVITTYPTNSTLDKRYAGKPS